MNELKVHEYFIEIDWIKVEIAKAGELHILPITCYDLDAQLLLFILRQFDEK